MVNFLFFIKLYNVSCQILNYMKTLNVVAAIIKKDDKILATKRGYGEFINMWEFPGGKIEPNESKEEALIREIKEETNLDIQSFTYHGEIIFKNDDYEEVMYLYTSDDFLGEMKPCDEGELHWVKKKDIMNLNLWEGDKVFLPLLIEGKKDIKLTLVYSGKKLVKMIK